MTEEQPQAAKKLSHVSTRELRSPNTSEKHPGLRKSRDYIKRSLTQKGFISCHDCGGW